MCAWLLRLDCTNDRRTVHRFEFSADTRQGTSYICARTTCGIARAVCDRKHLRGGENSLGPRTSLGAGELMPNHGRAVAISSCRRFPSGARHLMVGAIPSFSLSMMLPTGQGDLPRMNGLPQQPTIPDEPRTPPRSAVRR